VADVAPTAARFLESHGATVTEGDFPRWEPAAIDEGTLPYAADHYAAAEAMRPDFLERHGDELTPFIRNFYERGRRVLAWQYRRALRQDQDYRNAVRAWFVDNEVDYIVMQSTGTAPVATTIEEGIRSPSLRDLVHFNMARNPAASIPFGEDPASGLPLAIQIIGRVGDDAGVMRVARVFERDHPWSGRTPVKMTVS
jgi:Asp-tRNA(Asn)/Glu-tRNA(Gln) amidotransferase A subunit family amidase